jgi:hypothetical protein
MRTHRESEGGCAQYIITVGGSKLAATTCSIMPLSQKKAPKNAKVVVRFAGPRLARLKSLGYHRAAITGDDQKANQRR